MDDKMLRKVQLIQLKMLNDFDKVCKKHNISYILSSGTLLGAVRHKGFIPWDDDLDVDMTRENYDRFLTHAHELGTQYCVQNWHTDPEFALPFSKIRRKDTVYKEHGSLSLGNCGIYIDIFPCDKIITDRSEKSRLFRLNLYRLMLLHLSPAYDSKRWNLRLRIALSLLTLPYHSEKGRKKLCFKYERLAKKHNHTSKLFRYFENGGARAIGKWIIEKQCFDDIVSLPFEGEDYPCPKDYDGYLRNVYGDYMILPPEESRHNRHNIAEIKFGDNAT